MICDVYLLLADASRSYMCVLLGIICDMKVLLSRCWDILTIKLIEDSDEVRKIRKHCQCQAEIFLLQRLSLFLKYKYYPIAVGQNPVDWSQYKYKGGWEMFCCAQNLKEKKHIV